MENIKINKFKSLANIVGAYGRHVISWLIYSDSVLATWECISLQVRNYFTGLMTTVSRFTPFNSSTY